MALRRVRSKTDPKFESVVSDEWIAAWPDDWELLDDDAVTPKSAVAPPVDDDDDRGGIVRNDYR